jgi:hypothetical protein
MKIKGYIIAAALLIVFVYIIYFLKFAVLLGYSVSDDPAAWGQIGDYAGGILNPLLSFISIVLLIKSLSLQHQANSDLRREVKNNEKTEKLRSFEILFFNLLEAQKTLFDTFKVNVPRASGEAEQLTGAKAVIAIEEEIEAKRSSGANDQQITDYLDGLDEYDQVFGISRSFYILAMVINDKLNDSEGFSSSDRIAHYKTLINFTDFSQLRLIMMCVQFMDYESAKYLRSTYEFTNVVGDLGLSYEMY